MGTVAVEIPPGFGVLAYDQGPAAGHPQAGVRADSGIDDRHLDSFPPPAAADLGTGLAQPPVESPDLQRLHGDPDPVLEKDAGQLPRPEPGGRDDEDARV